MKALDRAKCRLCKYSFTVNVGQDSELLPACTYILFGQGCRRPCPPGIACTVFEPRNENSEKGEALR